MKSSSYGLLAAVAIMATGGTSTWAQVTVNCESCIVTERGMPDVRIHAIDREGNEDLFDMRIESKDMTYAEYFNGKTTVPTMSYPRPEADDDADVLTKAEQEAGLSRWWSDQDGEAPDDAAKAEFDEVAGQLQRSRFYTIANPVGKAIFDDMKAQGKSDEEAWNLARRALTFQGGYDLEYQGMVFGAEAAKSGMTLSIASQHIVDTLGVPRAQAEGYLKGPNGNGYGEATFDFYFQKKAPLADGDNFRGDYTDADLYDKVSDTVAEFKPVVNGKINPDLHPGTQAPQVMDEPFDPGATAVTDTATLANTNMETYAVYRDADGNEVVSRNYFYVENYRQVTTFEADFEGELANTQVQNSYQVQEGVRTPTAFPFNNEDMGSATLELDDQAQVAGAFRAIFELGDGLNGYVLYHSKKHDKDVVLYWVSPTSVPGGGQTRWGTSIRGPGLGPQSNEEPSILEELALANPDLSVIDPPESMRAWLDDLLFDPDTKKANRPEIVNALIKEGFESGSQPFGDYAPFAVYNSENGHYAEIPLDFDLSNTTDQQEVGVFQTGDVLVPQNYNYANAPAAKLYKLAYANTAEEDVPTDTSGNALPPTGENLFIEAQSCCGVTSIVGGSTVSSSDENRPSGQITAQEEVEQGTGTGAMIAPVSITATVPNDHRAAQDPIGDYDPLYPHSRIHTGLNVLPPIQGGSAQGVQGEDAKFYGNFVNDAPVWAHAPAHPMYAGGEFQPRTMSNPVDAEGVPFMNLNGVPQGANSQHPSYQDFRQGHRYRMTLTAQDNLAPLILPASADMQERGFPAEGYVCYPIRHMEYRVYTVEGDQETSLFSGVVVDGQANADSDCVETPPMVQFDWVPRADGPHFWEMYIVDVSGRDRRLISQVDVTGEASDITKLSEEGRRADN